MPPIMFGSRKTTGAGQIPATAPMLRGTPQPAPPHPPEPACQPPTERHHPADANANKPGGFRARNCRSHRETDLGESQEAIEECEEQARYTYHTSFVRVDQFAAQELGRSKRRREFLDGEVPRHSRDAVHDRKQRDESSNVGKYRRVRQRTEQPALDSDSRPERDPHSENEGRPVGNSPLHELPCDARRE